MEAHTTGRDVASQRREDPWRHRAQGMRCRSCMYYVRKLPDQSQPQPVDMAELGRCRRHAPGAGGAGWPVVFAEDWCGDHKLDENRV